MNSRRAAPGSGEQKNKADHRAEPSHPLATPCRGQTDILFPYSIPHFCSR